MSDSQAATTSEAADSGAPVIRTRGLTKRFRRTTAVDGLDLEVRAGGVHGFLGPNGAGKTTTLTMLVGLSRPTSGEIELFGQPVPRQFDRVSQRVGALIEAPAFLDTWSGRQNLRLLGRSVGLSRTRVDEVLDVVGLGGQGGKKFGQYSLGMKQRLGIAAALLKDPDLVILDEPANGLDPAGIRDIRETVRHLGEHGTTVLLSSHNLAEVQQVCDEVSIIHHGKLIASGAVADLIGEQISRTRVGVSDPDAARTALLGAGHQVTRDGRDLVVAGHDHPEEISRLLAEKGLYVSDLSAVHADLESFFLDLTGERLTTEDQEDAR